MRSGPPPVSVREFGFELRLCAHLETAGDHVVARQVGGGARHGARRVLDIVTIEPGPGFDRRRAMTGETVPPAAIESDVGVAGSTSWPAATDLPPDPAARVLDRALAVGFFERVHRDGRVGVRRTARYPDWIGPITAIENKPDLGTPGDLVDQLRFDVSLGVVDRVILATASHVTRAHLNRIPDQVGVWRVRRGEAVLEVEVIREPERLAVENWGIELGDREPSARRIRPTPPAAKRRARIRIAEHAYGKGWRPAFPACEEVRSEVRSGSRAIPYCTWKGRVIDPAECGPACPGHAPADPPDIDAAAEREERTPWRGDPPGLGRRQTDLGAFDPEGPVEE